MADFGFINSDYYYSNATGVFNNYCNNKPIGITSYLYVPVHDDEYSFTGIIGPWPYLNTGLLPVRPPIPIFSGSGECIGCPKIASDSQYSGHRQFNETYLSNEWENIYPTFEPYIASTIPFLQTGLNVSWFKTGVPIRFREVNTYYAPHLQLIDSTASTNNSNIKIPYWNTNGAKIHIKYNIKGENYVRLVVGFTIDKVYKYDIEEVLDFSIHGEINNNIINNYPYSLYYAYTGFNTDFILQEPIYHTPIFIFDSCAVKNISKNLVVYGPAPGFHIFNRSRNLYTEDDSLDNENIYITYFAFIKKEGDEEIDPRQKVRAEISVAGFGHPNALRGLYVNDDSSSPSGTLKIIGGHRIGCDCALDDTIVELRDYGLLWGRGINVVSGNLNGNSNSLNQSTYMDSKFGSPMQNSYSYSAGGIADAGLNSRFQYINGQYQLSELKIPTLTGCSWEEVSPTATLSNIELCGPTRYTYPVEDRQKSLHHNPNPSFSYHFGRRDGYSSQIVYGTVDDSLWFKSSTINDKLSPFPTLYDSIGDFSQRLVDKRYTAHDIKYFITTNESEAIDGIVFDAGGYITLSYDYIQHPLFYIKNEPIFATEPKFKRKNIRYIGQNKWVFEFEPYESGGSFIHPYKKMIDYLDDFGIKKGSLQTFIDSNSCIPKYIVTTPISENINYYSGYIAYEISNTGIISISGNNSIIVKDLGDTKLNMYNIANSYKIFDPIILSDTGLFLEDINYIYPSNPNGLQGSPSKIIYDSGTNIVYNLAPFFGYYKYNLDTKCTTYNLSLNDYEYGDGGYQDLIVGYSNIYLLNNFKNTIYVIDKLDDSVVDTITGVKNPISMLWDETGKRLYINSYNNTYISIFDNNNISNPYCLTGIINFYDNEIPIKMEIFNNKLYTLTNFGGTSEYSDIVIISGINSKKGIYNAYYTGDNQLLPVASNSGYKRFANYEWKIYSLFPIVENNNIYVGTNSGIKIINSNTDTWLNTGINEFASNIEVPSRFLNLIPDSYTIKSDKMIFNDYNNKIYSIDTDLPFVLVLNTGTNQCEKIIDLSYPIGSAGDINFDKKTKNMYISTSDRLEYGILNNFVILGNRPKAQINFPSAPQLVNGNTYNLNITSNNNQTGILYKADNYPYILIDSSGNITLPTGAGVNNLEFKVFAGQMPTTGFAYSFDARVCKIGSTGTTSALSYNTGIGNYNPYVPPSSEESFLRSVRPNGMRMSGTISCDFDDNQKIIALMSPSPSESVNSSTLKIFNFNNYDLLQTFSGYGSQVQMNGSGSLIAVTLQPLQSTGSALISIFTGVPTITGSYKLKQIITGLTGYYSPNPYILNRSGDILLGKNTYGSGIIYTGSLSSNWSIHSYISGSGISDFRLSNDGSVIIGCKHLLGYTDELAVFTGSKNNGWKFKTSLSISGVRIPYGSNSFFIKNEDIILFIESNENYLGRLTPIHIFTGSKNNGWNFKQAIVPSHPIEKVNISDDGKLIVLLSNNSLNLTLPQIISLTGSKDLGWEQRDWMYVEGRYSDQLMISHKNYLATFNYSPNYTNIWTYSGV